MNSVSLLTGSMKCLLPGLSSTLRIVVKLSINTVALWSRLPESHLFLEEVSSRLQGSVHCL